MSFIKKNALLLGARIAQYAGKHLHKFITKRPEYQENKIVEALQLVIYIYILTNYIINFCQCHDIITRLIFKSGIYGYGYSYG